MPLLEVSGQPVHVADRGAGDAVVFLHAFPLQAAMWDYQVEAIEATHRCLAIDMPGFGESPGAVDPGATTMQGWAGLVDGVLDRLGIPSATIVGCSMGGYLAMALLRHHRSHVAQLVLSDTRARADDPATAQRRTTSSGRGRRSARCPRAWWRDCYRGIRSDGRSWSTMCTPWRRVRHRKVGSPRSRR